MTQEQYIEYEGVTIAYEIDRDGNIEVGLLSLERMVLAGLASDMDRAWDLAFEVIAELMPEHKPRYEVHMINTIPSLIFATDDYDRAAQDVNKNYSTRYLVDTKSGEAR